MGTDIDFAMELKKHKLVSSQFQQPVHELDGVTENTEQPNGEFILQLIQMLERRLGNRLGTSEGPVAIVVHLGDNQRLLIAFPAVDRVRRDEPPRESEFQRHMREILTQPQQLIQEQIPEQRQVQSALQIPLLPEIPLLETQQIEVRPNVHQQHELLDHERIIDQETVPLEVNYDSIVQQDSQNQEKDTISSKSLPDEEELRHFQSVVQCIPEEHQKEDNNQPEEKQKPLNLENTNEMALQSHHKLQQDHLPKQSIGVDIQNQTINCLNQNSLPKVEQNSKRVIQQQPFEEDSLSCWQTFVRYISNLFGRRRSAN